MHKVCSDLYYFRNNYYYTDLNRRYCYYYSEAKKTKQVNRDLKPEQKGGNKKWKN